MVRVPELELAKRLLPLRAAPIDTALADEAVASAMARPSFGTLVDMLPTSREAALGVVWRLIARGRIGVDVSVPITPATTVWAS